jgi:hypothetical protein
VGFHPLDSSSLGYSTSWASEAERFPTAWLSPSGGGFAKAPPTSCEPSNCLSRDGVRRCADGGSPSGIATADDRRRLRVRPIIDHVSPRRMAAEGAGRRKTRGRGRIGLPLAGLGIHPWLWVFAQFDSSSLWYSASWASEAERFRAAGLSPSVRGFAGTPATSCEPYGHAVFRGRALIVSARFRGYDRNKLRALRLSGLVRLWWPWWLGWQYGGDRFV